MYDQLTTSSKHTARSPKEPRLDPPITLRYTFFSCHITIPIPPTSITSLLKPYILSHNHAANNPNRQGRIHLLHHPYLIAIIRPSQPVPRTILLVRPVLFGFLGVPGAVFEAGARREAFAFAAGGADLCHVLVGVRERGRRGKRKDVEEDEPLAICSCIRLLCRGGRSTSCIIWRSVMCRDFAGLECVEFCVWCCWDSCRLWVVAVESWM